MRRLVRGIAQLGIPERVINHREDVGGDTLLLFGWQGGGTFERFLNTL